MSSYFLFILEGIVVEPSEEAKIEAKLASSGASSHFPECGFAITKVHLGQGPKTGLAIASKADIVQLDLDSMKEFEKTSFSDHIFTKSFMHGFGAINWVILST